MKTVALISGGKDSCYNMMQCVAEGHNIVALANLYPKDADELDSYMYQTVGHHAIDLYAEAMALPLYRRVIQGLPTVLDRNYTPTKGDEVEDLYELLKEIKEDCGVEAVSVGAILSDYQRVRVEHVCKRLNLVPLAYLWRRDQKELLSEMIGADVNAIIIKVAALGLTPSQHLGKSLKEIYPHMIEMNVKYGLNICGEGGEYETFTLDCPLFVKSIILDEAETVVHSDDAFAPVAYLNLRKMHCSKKHISSDASLSDRIAHISMLRSDSLPSQLGLTSHDLSSATHEGDGDLSPCVLSSLGDLCAEPQISTNENGEFWITGISGRTNDQQTSIEDVADTALTLLQHTVVSLCEAAMSDVVSVSIHVLDMKDFRAIDSVYSQYFSSNPPVRLCVGACLPDDVRLLIEAYGCRDNRELRRRSMHVQSVSHWAPASIGHYSQAMEVGARIHVSGQIALCPATNSLVSGGIVAECRLSLRHVTRILDAMHPGTTLRDCVETTCYVTHGEHCGVAQTEWRKENAAQRVSRESDGHSVRFIVVPSLPRGALVEWRVTADTSDAASVDDR